MEEEEEISYSRWEREIDNVKELDEENFRALFDARYPDKLNEVMRIFLEAYARAVQETKEKGRFPNLKEIQDQMDKGEIYNIKRRLVEFTEFFDVISTKGGGTYLKPRARSFVDLTGRYAHLVFDFDSGEVILPRLRTLGWDEYRSEWEDLEKMGWHVFFSLDRPVLYVLLLVVIMINLFLVSALMMVLSKL